MASGLGLDILQDSSKFPCAVCRTGVGRSSIRCSKRNLWVHYNKCSGLKTLAEDMSYECPLCRGEPGVRPVVGRPFKEVEVGDCVLEAVDRFATWVTCSGLVVAVWLLPLLDAGVPGVSFEKTFLCSRPSLCLSTWGVVCLALMYVVQCYMVRKLGPWFPTPFTDCVVTIALWSAGFVGSNRRMTHQWTICMPSYGYATLPFRFGNVGLGGLGMSCVPVVRWIGWGQGQSLGGRVLDGGRRHGMSAWSKTWKCVVYLRPALRIECHGDRLWRTVDRSLPRQKGALFRAWLRLWHGVFWGCAPAPLTKLDYIYIYIYAII